MPTGNLPSAGKKIFEKVYKESLKGSCKGDKGCASSIAWTAVKNAGYAKKDGKWVKKSEDVLQEFSMYITKASFDNGVMRWAATNSDTDFDSYEERMSLDLYKDFIVHIQNEEPLPEQFKSVACSSYWCGGMPYLSVSHYPDLNGSAVPGEPLELFIDGQKLKAKGVLFDTPLGHSVHRALKEDKYKNPENKIRISIGFLDLAHKHGENGKVWTRDSLFALCPDCLQGIGNKIYVKGYLVHLALTRVPVNRRTEMVLEEKSDMTKKITRKEDAASIVGNELADEIEMKQKAMPQRSDALVEMSDSEEPTEEETNELIEEVEGEQPVEVVEESEAVVEDAQRKDVTPADKKRAEKKYGDVTYADPANKKYPVDTEEHIKAAWSYIHMPKNAKKYSPAEVAAIKKRIIAAWKRVIGGEPPSVEGKSEAEIMTILGLTEESMDGDGTDPEDQADTNEVPMMNNLPFGGATSMQDAQKFMDAKDEMMYVLDSWNVFQNVAWNIMQREDCVDKKSALSNAVSEFQKVLAAKAMVLFSAPAKAEEEKPSHGLQSAIDGLIESVDNSLQLDANLNEKLASINPALQQLGEGIRQYVETKSQAVVEEKPVPQNENLLEEMKNLFQPVVESVKTLSDRVGVLEAKATTNMAEPKPRIPQPRTISAEVYKSVAQPENKPMSIKDIARKSVGL